MPAVEELADEADSAFCMIMRSLQESVHSVSGSESLFQSAQCYKSTSLSQQWLLIGTCWIISCDR